MKIDVFCGEENMGDVIGDLNRRRGMIKSQEPASTGIRIKADAPLSEMFGYIGNLRTMTSEGDNSLWNFLTTQLHLKM